MANLLEDAWEIYAKNIKLVLLFSIPFIISVIIPMLALRPTYIASGAIFLRSASIFLDINAVSVAVIIVSLFLSLLFLSFAFVAISLIVKGERTYTKHARTVIRDIEKYTGKVFVVLLFYAFALVLSNMLGYSLGIEGITPIVGFFLFIAVFYAPTAIVIDNKRVLAAMKQSVVMVIKKPQYFVVWFVLITLVLSVIDFVVIAVAGALLSQGTILSQYLLLVVNSLFVLPYFIIYQAEAYMRRFSILKH
jgi:hypothetical protein